MNRIYSLQPLLGLSLVLGATAQPAAIHIQISNTPVQTSVTRFGVNLGNHGGWEAGQVLKNLVWRNPGFEALQYRNIFKCVAVTSNSCMDVDAQGAQPTGFWQGGSYRFISGSSVGKTGIVLRSIKDPDRCSACGQMFQFDQSLHASVGDFFVISSTFLGSGEAGWRDSTNGGGSISTEMSDISAQSPGKQALLLSAKGNGQSAGVSQYFGASNSGSAFQLNGAFQLTFRAKGVGGNNQLNVDLSRTAAGSSYIHKAIQLTDTWQDYTLSFSVDEAGSAKGKIQLSFGAAGAEIELDDVSFEQTNSDPSNTTAFQDDVVDTLRELHPGTIRMVAASNPLASDLINQLQVPFTLSRGGSIGDSDMENDGPYDLHEFLQLCQAVHADPWITIPATTTSTEMTYFIQYLTGAGLDPGSSRRIARGQAQPWTSVFKKIHLELDKETRSDAKGNAPLPYRIYAQTANSLFKVARSTQGYIPKQFDLVLNGGSSASGYNEGLLLASNQQDSITIEAGLPSRANNQALPTVSAQMSAQPELHYTPADGGEVYPEILLAQNATVPTYVNLHEPNWRPMQVGRETGKDSPPSTETLPESFGAAMVQTEQMLRMIRAGVKYQNPSTLAQVSTKRGENSVSRGTLVDDSAITFRRTPQFWMQTLVNRIIGGNMLEVFPSNVDSTWNQPSRGDHGMFKGMTAFQSFAFENNGRYSVILFNLSQTTSLPVKFLGPVAPFGTVEFSQITSQTITDVYQADNAVELVTQSQESLDPAVGLTLPPFSMTALSWTPIIAAHAPAIPAALKDSVMLATALSPKFSPPGGIYPAAQTVSISDGTVGIISYSAILTWNAPATSSDPIAGYRIYRSTNGGAYALVNSSLITGNSFTDPGLPGSTNFNYEVVSVDAKGVQSNPSNIISLTTPSSSVPAVIHYTVDGSTPTASSSVYSGPLAVNSSETIQAVAIAVGYTDSAVASASYTIAPVINFGSGFTATGLSLHVASVVNHSLRITDGGLNESNYAWFTTPVNVQKFTTDFTFQNTNANSDGFTFTVQNAPAGAKATGSLGSSLGYEGITKSVAIKFDLHNNAGEGPDSTGFYINGAAPTVPALDMTSSGVNLHSSDTLQAHITYDGTTLKLTLTDTVSGARFTASKAINIPSTVGANTAYVGFTSSTGTASSVQSVLTWTYSK